MSEFIILPELEEGYLIFESEEDAKNFAGPGDVVVEVLQLFDVAEEADDPEHS